MHPPHHTHETTLTVLPPAGGSLAHAAAAMEASSDSATADVPGASAERAGTGTARAGGEDLDIEVGKRDRRLLPLSKYPPIQHALLGSFGDKKFASLVHLIEADLDHVFHTIMNRHPSMEEQTKFCKCLVEVLCANGRLNIQRDDLFSKDAHRKMLHGEFVFPHCNEWLLSLLFNSLNIEPRERFRTSDLKCGNLETDSNDARWKAVFSIDFFNQLYTAIPTSPCAAATKVIDLVSGSPDTEQAPEYEPMSTVKKRIQKLLNEPVECGIFAECHSEHATTIVMNYITGDVTITDSLNGAPDDKVKIAIQNFWKYVTTEVTIKNIETPQVPRQRGPDCVLRATLNQFEAVLGTKATLLHECSQMGRRQQINHCDQAMHRMRTWILLASSKEGHLLYPEKYLNHEEAWREAAKRVEAAPQWRQQRPAKRGNASDTPVRMIRSAKRLAPNPTIHAAAVADGAWDSDDMSDDLTLNELRSRAQLKSSAAAPPATERGTDSEDDADIPLLERIQTCSAVASLKSSKDKICEPGVGDVVEIYWRKWNPSGWFAGTVKLKSDGKAKYNKRLIQDGFFLVDYGKGGQFVHLLNAEMHVSNRGVQDMAWRLADKAGHGAGTGIHIKTSAAPSPQVQQQEQSYGRGGDGGEGSGGDSAAGIATVDTMGDSADTRLLKFINSGVPFARNVDKCAKRVLCKQQMEDQAKYQTLRSIIQTLTACNNAKITSSTESNVEKAIPMLRQYIDKFIFICNIASAPSEDLGAQRRHKGTLPLDSSCTMVELKPMLEWVISEFLPNVGDLIYQNMREQSSIRTSIIRLLPGTLSVPEQVPEQGINSIIVDSDLSCRDQCFGCFASRSSFEGSGNKLWVCSHPLSENEHCCISYCSDCLGKARKRSPDPAFLCPLLHQGRPKENSNIFPAQRCFGCVHDTRKVAGVRALRGCQHCGKKYCPTCGLYDPAMLVNTSLKFTCPACYISPRDREKQIESRLMGLLSRAAGYVLDEREIANFNVEKCMKSSRWTYPALIDFAQYVCDVYKAGYHDLAGPYIKVMIDICFWLDRRKRPMLITPSQHIRLKGGSSESRRELAAISVSYAAELVQECAEVGTPAGQCWSTYVGPCDCISHSQQISIFVWMHDGSRPSPTVNLSSYLLRNLAGRFGRFVLGCRELSTEVQYDKNDGLVVALIEFFRKTGNLKLFAENASDEDIHAWLNQQEFHIHLDLTCLSDGNINSVLARPARKAANIGFLGYPGPHYGIHDFVISTKALVHPEILADESRSRFIFCDEMYPPVGDHNGHNGHKSAELPSPDFPNDGPPLLLFLGDPNKLRDESVFAFLDILSGTDKAPCCSDMNNVKLMIMQGSEDNMKAVGRWREEYNARRFGDEVIAECRIGWIPYRHSDGFWKYLTSVRTRSLSVSCFGASYDVNTLANDALECCMPHLGIRTKDQDWPTLVAPLLLEHAGLGGYFIANSREDFVKKGILLMLSPSLRNAATEHLLDCRENQVGHYNRNQCVDNMERALLHGLNNFRKASGNRPTHDIDLTQMYPVRAIRQFSPRPELSLELETSCTQRDRIMSQLPKNIVASNVFSLKIICKAVEHHHNLGYRDMQYVGMGSSTVAISTLYVGNVPELVRFLRTRNGARLMLKMSHCFKKIQQENRLITDAVVRAAYVSENAGLRRKELTARRILPQMFAAYKNGSIVCILRGSPTNVFSKMAPALCRPIIACAVFEFIEGGDLSANTLFRKIVSEWRDHGIISDKLTRIIQAVLFSGHFMHSQGIACMDLSFYNLGLVQCEYRWCVSWLDTGGSLVYRAGHAVEVQATRSITSFPDQGGSVPGPSCPAKALVNPRASNKGDIAYLNATKVEDCYKNSNALGLTCLGQDTFREDDVVNSIRQEKNWGRRPFEREDAVRWDRTGASMVVLQMFNPAPKETAKRDEWKEQLRKACNSPEEMFRFLQQGMSTGVEAERPEVLDEFAKLLFQLLRTDGQERITLRDALLKTVLTTDTLTLEQKRKMDGCGLEFPGGPCPDGSPWRESSALLPPLVIATEGTLGAGVRTSSKILKDQLVALYVGAEVSDINHLPPSRRTTYAMSGGNRIHAVSDQPFEWLQKHSFAGPLINASFTDTDANISIDRMAFWRDGKGLIFLPMFAKRDIEHGEFLHWKYDPFAGAGGADGYRFPAD